MNGGSCSGDNVCTCLDGFLGDKCQNKDPCNPDPCLNGGSCSGGSCTCPDGYSGEKCENKDPCLSVVCQNGGTCSDGECTCADGFEGSNCESKTPTTTVGPPTTGGNAGGASCVFPFIGYGSSYDACTNFGKNGKVYDYYWCATTSSYDQDKKWGKCPPKDDLTVNCGGHKAASCKDCPQGNGAAWCNGDCTWKSTLFSGECIPKPVVEDAVNCGGHKAASCAACPGSNGAEWCNGDCYWSKGSCITKPATINWIIYTEGTTPQFDNTGEIPGAVPGLEYDVSVEVLRSDLGSSDEYVSDITLEGKSLGSCNPDGNDYDCTFYRCPNTGKVTGPSDGKFDVNMQFRGHSHDCDCDKNSWVCSKENTVWGRKPMTAVS